MAAGHRFESATYYRLQADCMNALSGAKPGQRIALYCVAKLAETLAIALDAGGIEATAEGDWHSYADALEQVVRGLGAEKAAQELVWALAAAIDRVSNPKGRVD